MNFCQHFLLNLTSTITKNKKPDTLSFHVNYYKHPIIKNHSHLNKLFIPHYKTIKQETPTPIPT